MALGERGGRPGRPTGPAGSPGGQCRRELAKHLVRTTDPSMCIVSLARRQIDEEQIPDSWVCADNLWDSTYNSCEVEQELSDDRIDEILALQGEQELQAAQQQQMALEREQQLQREQLLQQEASAYDYGGYNDDPYYEEGSGKGSGRRGGRGGRWGRGRGRGGRGGRGGRRGGNGSGGSERGGARYPRGGIESNNDDAAQALLGMGGADGEGQVITQPREKTPPEFYPGRLVWAKVEGHDWWPGKVVRRRAVPREVGLPPGGNSPTSRFEIPVVFFAPRGIPGETIASCKDLDDAIEAMRPLPPDTVAAADEEAEYAWLTSDALKPFQLGDTSGSPDAAPTNEQLVECIQAANRAAELVENSVDTAEEGIATFRGYHSDSDGGWGPQSGHMALAGRRGGRGGRGRRGRGTRRGRGRGRWGVRYDDEDGTDDDFEPGYAAWPSEHGPGGLRIVVESILGWRRKAGSAGEKSKDGSDKQNEKNDNEKAMESAVDALLAASDGDEGTEFLVKYIGRSHIHNEWVPESTLLQISKRKILNFKKRYGCDEPDAQPINLTAESWSIPERFISRRPAIHGPGWEILVKWCSLGIESATWEAETEPFMARQQSVDLATQLWQRQAKALRRSLPQVQEKFESSVKEFCENMTEIAESPPYLSQKLMEHQLEGVNWLRKHWAVREHCMLADDQGLGKTATVLTFLRSLGVDFGCPKPMLIIAPSSSLVFWEGEFGQWLGDMGAVTYSGSAVARNLILENDIWLGPAALDGRGMQRPIIKSKIPKADIVLTSHEAFASDSSELMGINWEVVVFDERHRIPSASLKAHQSLGQLEASHRIALSWPLLTNNVQELLAEVTFLKPNVPPSDYLPDSLEKEGVSAQLAALIAQLEPLMMQRPRSIIGEIDVPSFELRLSVGLRKEQVESYKLALTKSYELLADPKASRFSGYRALQLRALVTELRNVCAHPLLDVSDVNTKLPTEIDNEEDLDRVLATSEKLQAFDQLLQAENKRGRRVAVFAHSSGVLAILGACIGMRFGKDSYVSISATTPSLDCHKAITTFNAAGSDASFILMHPNACGLGTSLEKLDSVIFFDSDWSVASDVIAMYRARKMGDTATLRVYRLYCENTVEERLIDLAEKTRGLGVALRQSHGRAYSQSSKVLDDILRAGAAVLFEKAVGTPVKEEAHAPTDKAADAKPEDAADGGGASKDATMPKVESVHNDYFTGDSSLADQRTSKLIEANIAEIYEAAPDKESPVVLDATLKGATIADIRPLKPDPRSHQFDRPDLEEEDGMEHDESEVPVWQSRAESAVQASKFWRDLLAEEWQKYQREQGAVQDATAEDEDDEYDNEDQHMYGRGAGTNVGLYDDDDAGHRRRGKGRGRGRGRGSRARRSDDEDYEFGSYAKKRRKRGEVHHPALTEEALEYIAEWNRQTVVMNAIADPSTAEALIARNGFDRLDAMGKELGLPRDILDLSHQCAQILLVMRPSEETPSDFQDYTLVAVMAVATYLGQYPMGEQHGVPALARKYGQNLAALEQVFEYIIASVNNYRETYMRMHALQEQGALDDDDVDKISRGDGHPTGGLMAAMSDLDGFATKLHAILQADLRAAAVAAGPINTPEINLVANADPENVDHLREVSEKLMETHREVDILDRVQNIRVKNIQEEYQRFMERVRSKAQSAIDHANTTYSQQRNVLIARYEALSAQLAKDFPDLASLAPSARAIGLNVMGGSDGGTAMNLNMAMGNDASSAVGINPMNMLSHSMASQLLALQSHWAANVAAQGLAISPEQMEQYSQMLSKGAIVPGGNVNGDAALTAPAAPPPGSQAALHPDEEKITAARKSLMEMMEEDFEPEGVAADGTEPAADVPALNSGVNRVGSLSGWIPPQGGLSNGNSPSKANADANKDGQGDQ